ncbi:MAG TPA: hypothetical protein VMR41_05730 [Patescibacteria group bacterium]|nr:hypothetical protein [Patescibacteria group bacterium]
MAENLSRKTDTQETLRQSQLQKTRAQDQVESLIREKLSARLTEFMQDQRSGTILSFEEMSFTEDRNKVMIKDRNANWAKWAGVGLASGFFAWGIDPWLHGLFSTSKAVSEQVPGGETIQYNFQTDVHTPWNAKIGRDDVSSIYGRAKSSLGQYILHFNESHPQSVLNDHIDFQSGNPDDNNALAAVLHNHPEYKAALDKYVQIVRQLNPKALISGHSDWIAHRIGVVLPDSNTFWASMGVKTV